jgi:hypothetical protein
MIDGARRMTFGPVTVSYSAAMSAAPLTHHEILALCLDCLATGSFRLTRHLSLPGRATATYEPVGVALGALELPEDLLAVLGWDWARLVRTADGWKSKLRLRGNLSRRSDRAEAALDRPAVHLARTLAEPPARFHDTWRAARPATAGKR